MPGGWRIGPRVQQSIWLDGIGIYSPVDVISKINDKLVPSRSTTDGATGVALGKDWEMVAYEPDWHIVNRRETREARGVTNPDLPVVEEHGHEHELLPKPLATIAVPNEPASADMLTEKSDGKEKQFADAPTASSQPPTPTRQSYEELLLEKPKQAYFPPREDRYFALLLPTVLRTEKHNPNELRPLSAEDEDLPFLPDRKNIPLPPPPDQKARTRKKVASKARECPQIIQRLRAMAEVEQESPKVAATLATREAGRRMDERLARIDRVPSDWYGVSHEKSLQYRPQTDF